MPHAPPNSAPQGLQGLAARLLGLRTEASSWEAGAKGERIVDKRLNKLRRDGWTVLSSIVKRSGADIDHLVIGPTGVFTINTKHHRDARIWVGENMVTVNNAKKPHYLRNSRHEAASAARILSNAIGIDVTVTPGETIDRVLRHGPARYSPQERDQIYAAARRADIWLA